MRGLAVVLSLGLLAGCSTATRQRPVDVTGQWVGTWSGAGVFVVPRDEDVALDLVQTGAVGTGRMLMHSTLAVLALPDSVRDAGMTGVRVIFDVSGNRLHVWHELGGDLFEAELTVLGDRMIGRVLRTDPLVSFDLTRGRVELAGLPTLTPPAVAPPVVTPRPVPPPRMPPPSAVAPPTVPPPPVAPPPVVAAPPVAPPPPLVTEPPSVPPPPADVVIGEVPSPSEFNAVPELQTIYFDFDSADIRPSEAVILDANAEWLRANPGRLLLIEGHSDERGTSEYNLALGARRAAAAKSYLVSRGIPEGRITVTTYGFERPECTEHSDECWARNRRAAFLVK